MIKFLNEITQIHVFFYIIYNLFAIGISLVAGLLLFIVTMGQTKSIKYVQILSTVVGAIVFSSLSVSTVLKYKSDFLTMFLYSLIAGILLLFNLISGAANTRYEVRKGAKQNGLYGLALENEIEETEMIQMVYLCAAIIFFILTLFFPIIADNPMNQLFISIKDWLMELKIVKWIVVASSFVLLIFYAWTFTIYMSSFFSWISTKK